MRQGVPVGAKYKDRTLTPVILKCRVVVSSYDPLVKVEADSSSVNMIDEIIRS